MEVLVNERGEPKYRMRVGNGGMLARVIHVKQKIQQLERPGLALQLSDILLYRNGSSLNDTSLLNTLPMDAHGLLVLDMLIVKKSAGIAGEAMQRRILESGLAGNSAVASDSVTLYLQSKRAQYLRENAHAGQAEPWAKERELLHTRSPATVSRTYGDMLLLGLPPQRTYDGLNVQTVQTAQAAAVPTAFSAQSCGIRTGSRHAAADEIDSDGSEPVDLDAIPASQRGSAMNAYRAGLVQDGYAATDVDTIFCREMASLEALNREHEKGVVGNEAMFASASCEGDGGQTAAQAHFGAYSAFVDRSIANAANHMQQDIAEGTQLAVSSLLSDSRGRDRAQAGGCRRDSLQQAIARQIYSRALCRGQPDAAVSIQVEEVDIGSDTSEFEVAVQPGECASSSPPQ